MNAETREALARQLFTLDFTLYERALLSSPRYASQWADMRESYLIDADAFADVIDAAVADAERRGAERGWDEGFNARVRWQVAEAGGQMVRGALLSNPYRADAQTPSKQGETDG